jgi:osmotically-inducible protein OsmY
MGVINLIEIEPDNERPVSPYKLKDEIERAFSRNAEIDARRLEVQVDDSKVTLSGKVGSLAEERQAVRAAWHTLGVRAVKNHLQIVP